MRRTLPALFFAALVALPGCGGDEGLDYSLRTPPPYVGAAPIAPPGQRIVEREMTSADAEQLRPVIADWATAVREGDIDRAADHFSLPAIVSMGGDALQVNSPQVAEAFNASLPCAAKLLAAVPDGRYLVGTFVLVDVGMQPCRERGEISRVGFVFGDKDHPRLFSEWWQLATTAPDARPGPEKRPRRATPATVSDFS